MKLITNTIAASFLLSFSAASFAQQVDAKSATPDITVNTETVVDASTLEYSNKWRIKFDNRTDSAGEIVFLFAMKNKQPISISISVAKDLSENDIAKLVENALRKNAPKGVKAERDDGEDVLVKFKNRFSLTLVSNTVADLDIDLDKE